MHTLYTAYRSARKLANMTPKDAIRYARACQQWHELEWQDKVFDPFCRVLPESVGDTSFADTPRRGMGLGLAHTASYSRLASSALR